MTLLGKVEEQEIEMIKEVITEIINRENSSKEENEKKLLLLREDISSFKEQIPNTNEKISEMRSQIEILKEKEEVLRTNFIKMSEILINVTQKLKLLPEEEERDEIEEMFETRENLEKEIPLKKPTDKDKLFNLLPENKEATVSPFLRKNNIIPCLKCKKEVAAKNICLERKNRNYYAVGECPYCGRKVVKLAGRSDGEEEQEEE
jgi:DNA-directed RNA polymerase subunit RPC12/RpoP